MQKSKHLSGFKMGSGSFHNFINQFLGPNRTMKFPTHTGTRPYSFECFAAERSLPDELLDQNSEVWL